MVYGFKVQQKIFALRATYNIYDLAKDEKIFVARRKILAFRPEIEIKDMNDQKVITIKSNFLFRNRWKIIQNNNLIGEVKFPIIRLFGFKFELSIAGNNYEATNIFGYSFTAVDDMGRIGFVVDKKFFSFRDSYKVEVHPPLEPLFGLAAAIAIDSKYHEGKRR